MAGTFPIYRSCSHSKPIYKTCINIGDFPAMTGQEKDGVVWSPTKMIHRFGKDAFAMGSAWNES
jgi:hypothetical protein